MLSPKAKKGTTTSKDIVVGRSITTSKVVVVIRLTSKDVLRSGFTPLFASFADFGMLITNQFACLTLLSSNTFVMATAHEKYPDFIKNQNTIN